mmetsp:Transcript_7490/g.16611  ORF Transcript_7490/g.16611 Transcript_7490/m.16611 type:complete len:590 (+) Transcript_7490:141-1910(+)
MSVCRVAVAVVIVTCLSHHPILAFNGNTLRPSAITPAQQCIRCASARSPLKDDNIHHHLDTGRQRCVNNVFQMNHNHDDEQQLIPDTSRRSVLLRFSSALLSATTLLASSTTLLSPSIANAAPNANAAEFSGSVYIDEQPAQSASWAETNPQKIDAWAAYTPRVTLGDVGGDVVDSTTTTTTAFASSPLDVVKPAVIQKQQSSQPVQPSSKASTQTKSKQIESKSSTQSKTKDVNPSDDHSAGSLATLAFPLLILGGAAYSFTQPNIFEQQARSNDEDAGTYFFTSNGTPKIKVVMVENPPYGLDKGRNYFNGVDVTINNPIPASDIRKYCDAAKPAVTNECTESITGFLEEVSHNSAIGNVNGSEEQVEKASVIISYLDNLAKGMGSSDDDVSRAGAAFSSYLEGLSNGNLPAPSSAESVAVYLDSLASPSSPFASRNDVQRQEPSQQQSFQQQRKQLQRQYQQRRLPNETEYERGIRLATLESKMNQLESSVHQLPDEISARLQQWQYQQDERLRVEMNRISTVLMQNQNNQSAENDGAVNGGYENRGYGIGGGGRQNANDGGGGGGGNVGGRNEAVNGQFRSNLPL